MSRDAYLRSGNSHWSCSLRLAVECLIDAERTWSPRPGYLPIKIKSDSSLDLIIENIPPASGPCRNRWFSSPTPILAVSAAGRNRPRAAGTPGHLRSRAVVPGLRNRHREPAAAALERRGAAEIGSRCLWETGTGRAGPG